MHPRPSSTEEHERTFFKNVNENESNHLHHHSDIWSLIQKDQKFLPLVQSTNAKPADCTRVVCISDTHGRHRELGRLPPGDILVHAGDLTLQGELPLIADLKDYFGKLSSSFSQIFVIGGNHDKVLHEDYYLTKVKPGATTDIKQAREDVSANANYLHDSGTILPSGMEVYGSPWSPDYHDWAFMLARGGEIRAKWMEIPASTDILIAHGPPLGRNDFVPGIGHVGCHDLMEEIQQRIKPRLCVFGHIHEAHGVSFDGITLYANASSVDIRYTPSQHPIVIDVPHDGSKPAMMVPPNLSNVGLIDIPDLCKAKGWNALGKVFDSVDLAKLTESLGDSFSILDHNAHSVLSESLQLKRNEKVELAKSLGAFYAASFPSVK